MIKNILKIIFGVVFIVSAILKIKTLDNFELYVFGLEFFSLDTSILLSRLIIGFELFLGIMLCVNVYKSIINISIFVTVIFTLFLIHRVIIGDIENCQCFGNNIHISPLQSILKNLFILIGLLWVRDSNYFIIRYRKGVTSVLLLLAISIPNIASPPDFLYYKEYSSYATYNSKFFDDFIESNLNAKIDEKVIICFMSTNCHFCKLTAKKISTIAQRHKICQENILYVFIDSSEIDDYISNTNSITIPYIQIPQTDLLKVTNGIVPLVILYENNKVIDSFIYRNINERKIIDFYYQ